VWSTGSYHGHQCSRKRGHGPEGAYCKQHSPEAKAARKAKSDAKNREWNINFSKKIATNEAMREALLLVREIAEGHNNPRGAALDLIASYDEKLKEAEAKV